MLNYNFLNLSPFEFENLTRDLLQKKLNIFIESFTDGRDGGIDLRCALDKQKTVIIQAKRYEKYSNLLVNLKKEVKKVIRLTPSRYIITTSVGLTPNNKNEIYNLFSPHILHTEDIMGKDDLNNLLGQHEYIEHKYYKLWLSSTNILNKILNSKIFNQSIFELSSIEEQLKRYVQNDSFNKALKIIKENHYIIISGIPGIGKTTLGRNLAYYLLVDEFDEFIYLSDSIDEGYKLFKPEAKQVFFFDDFLGRVRFEANTLINAESKIVKFIDHIKSAKGKVLIFCTREYILKEAMDSFDLFRIHNIELAKCILDLSSYTKLIKAQIMYNHLFFSDIPLEYLQDIVSNKKYLKLISHRNYSPRIIEAVIKRKLWLEGNSSDFANNFINFFNNPESVWLIAYEKLDKLSQYLLLVLLSLGTPVLMDDLEAATKSFIITNGLQTVLFDSIIYKQKLRILEDSFIITNKDDSDKIAIEYQNPSIQDFLINYLKKDNTLIVDILNSSIFVSQFFNIFTTKNNPYNNKIVLSSTQSEIAINRILQVFKLIKSAAIIKTYNSNSGEKFSWLKFTNEFKYSFLDNMNDEFSAKYPIAQSFIIQEFQKLILLDSFFSSRTKILFLPLKLLFL